MATSTATIKTKPAWQLRAAELAEHAIANLGNRTDAMGTYGSSGPTCRYLPNAEQLRAGLVEHFQAVTIGGLYPNSKPDSEGLWDARFGCVDLDLKPDHPRKEFRQRRNHFYAMLILRKLESAGISCLVEDSNGRGGYHIWFRLSESIPVARLYAFLRSLVADAEEHGFERSFQCVDENEQPRFLPNGKPVPGDDRPETFPAQSKASDKGLGNFIRLPGRHHTHKDHWSRCWGDGEWLDEKQSVDAWLTLPAADTSLIPEIPVEEPAQLEPVRTSKTVTAKAGETLVDLAERTIEIERWCDLLEGAGWTKHSENGTESTWTRPGKDNGVSATLNFKGSNLFHVFSSAVSGLEQNQNYGKWRFYLWTNGFENRQVEAAKAYLPVAVVAEHERKSRDTFLKLQDANLASVDLSRIVGDKAATENKQRIDFGIIDSRTFAGTVYATEYLIDGVMINGLPQLYGGPSKTLKTSILVDQCLSLSSATPFLGRFDVPKTKRCLMLSSESGTATLQETAKRICKAKGIDLGELGDIMHWGFRPPQLTDAKHNAELTDFVLKNRIDVIAIDPAYLSMNLQGNDASNQFAVGAVLSNLTTLQADTGCTPILAAHFRMHMLPGILPGFEHVAGAGFSQWARQWFMLNRREEFNPDSPGLHRLLMTFGGSSGHCGAYGLDIEEGRAADGRFWNVSLNSLSQIREDKATERDNRKRDQEQRTYENHRVAILRAVKRFPGGETKTRIKETANMSSQNFGGVFGDLLSSLEIEPCYFDRGELKADDSLRTYAGFRFVDPASRLKTDSRTLTDSDGLSPIESG